MAKQILYYGKTIDELKGMSIQDFAQIAPARARRTIKRGFSDAEKQFLKVLEQNKPDTETHCRDMIILPSMVGRVIKVHNGKEWARLDITIDMIGHRLGEFSQTRKKVSHSAPGIGATRSSAALSVR